MLHANDSWLEVSNGSHWQEHMMTSSLSTMIMTSITMMTSCTLADREGKSSPTLAPTSVVYTKALINSPQIYQYKKWAMVANGKDKSTHTSGTMMSQRTTIKSLSYNTPSTCWCCYVIHWTWELLLLVHQLPLAELNRCYLIHWRCVCISHVQQSHTEYYHVLNQYLNCVWKLSEGTKISTVLFENSQTKQLNNLHNIEFLKSPE